MPRPRRKPQIDNYTHEGDSRRNIPTAEVEPVMDQSKRAPIALEYERSTRNTDIDPQLVWRGKDEQDWSNLVVTAPPIFIQEKVHPRALINDLIRQSRRSEEERQSQGQADLFADFNGLDDPALRSDYYNHEQNWSNRMILGDSLQVMASLASREGLQGKVQCIYIDPPYGIRFNSNFQWSTTSRDVRDGNRQHITREPEQVRAYRDTWRDGIHSYLTYLRDRLTVARDLLADSGSIFVQIGDKNVHRVRSLLDEVFGDDNFVANITFRVKSPLGVSELARTTDFIIWYARNSNLVKFRQARTPKELGAHPEFNSVLLPDGRVSSRVEHRGNDDANHRYFTAQNLASSGYTESCMYPFTYQGRTFTYPRGRSWKTNEVGMTRLAYAGRLQPLQTSGPTS